MSVPVTARLDETVVEAIDRAVEAGLGRNRGAVVAAAFREWLAIHSEAEIVASYQRRYAKPDAVEEDLVARLSSFSVAACLADHAG